ncbi:MAG TPA: hypothetical protein VNZ64_14780 [Candidatus Acidoferrum sp.]|jgi:hypothetical protein|nr:hypothetical protein [Candidatus Acidoferrum sp.]
MGEFKFACPVCGQHITADSRASGTQLDCPTCFRKIVVPQAPAAGDSKLILEAAQVNKPRPTSTDAGSDFGPLRRSSSRSSRVAGVLLLLLIGASAASLFIWRGKLLKSIGIQTAAATNQSPGLSASSAPATSYPVPTNTSWSLDLTNAVTPAARAAGRIHGRGFECERATLQGGNLTLRQGRNWPPDLGVTVVLFAQQSEDLSGKTVVVAPERLPPVPRVVLRWKDEQGKAVNRTFNSGYALRVVFGQPANGRMPGEIYIGLPDEAKSFAAGTFYAEIRKPQPPQPRK